MKNINLVMRFAGCYWLQVDHGSAYRVRLLTRQVGRSWLARSLDHASGANTAGDSWSWTPLDTARVAI
ncbi:MAG: hypothetical protein ACR2GG_03420, partial [Gemmatimonadaceae bacterium]